MIRSLLEEHDRALFDVFASLSDDEWTRPSLCEGWTNVDVLAHLVVGYRFPVGDLGSTMARTRAAFDDVNDRMTRHVASITPIAELIDEFSAHSTKPLLRTRLLFPARLMLGDHLTHHLDVVLPLGRPPAISDEAFRVILGTQVRLPNPFVPARRRAQGLRIEATDLNWRYGPTDGPAVHGTAAHLVSVLAGRPFAVADLHGAGSTTMEDRIGRTG